MGMQEEGSQDSCGLCRGRRAYECPEKVSLSTASA